MNALGRRFFAVFALAVAVEPWADDPYVILQPPREVRSRSFLQSGDITMPLSPASADFDRGGYPDLVCGYGEGPEGSLSVSLRSE